jgi:hypothetical protein
MSNRKLWKTKYGRSIPIREMTDEHLANTIRFLARAHARYVSSAVSTDVASLFNGEMAQMYAEQEQQAAFESTPKDLFPIYEDLMLEHTCRKADREAKELI